MAGLSIRQKLQLAFAAMALLVLALSVTAALCLRQDSRNFAAFVDEDVARLALTNELMHASNARAIAARNMVLTDDPEALKKEHERAVSAHRQVQAAHERLAAKIQHDADITPPEREAYQRLARIEQAYATVALRIVQAAFEGRKAEAVQDMNLNCYPLLDQLVAAASDYLALSQQQAAAAATEAQRATGAELALELSLAALAVAAASGLAWWLPGHILDPISDAIEIAEVTARGDLTRRIDIQRRDETGKLLVALQSMTTSLSDIVHRVREASDSITTGSAEIAVGNQDLSQRTEVQAANLEATSSTMGDMLHNVEGSSSTASEASRLANEASEAARAGGEVVDQVVATMAQISHSSRKISDIIATIDGIAFQTNILALNAAVEAARAGEQGRGFAVVAGEVRSLAQRSAEAAKEIRGLITDSVERVESGGKLVADAGASIHAVVDQVARVAALMQEIREASVHQHEGFSRINATVSALDGSTQQNAALVEQSAAAAESLRHQANTLRDAVAVFRV